MVWASACAVYSPLSQLVGAVRQRSKLHSKDSYCLIGRTGSGAMNQNSLNSLVLSQKDMTNSTANLPTRNM